MHQRNKHKGQYQFDKLIKVCPPLAAHVQENKYQNLTINFFDARAVKLLNKAILKLDYGIDYWDIPKGYLCPPIPGRADYIHFAADLLASCNHGNLPTGKKIKVLDVGTGANCVYPLIGHQSYAWQFVGCDIDAAAIASAKTIIHQNDFLQNKIELRLQENPKHIFEGILKTGERLDLTICNPPFHASAAAAQAGTRRKLTNLKKKKTTKIELNFGGQSNELHCEGGEKEFLNKMITESQKIQKSVLWFSSLVSKGENLKPLYAKLKACKAVEIKTIDMSQGNKKSRILAWTFLSPKQQKAWVAMRWRA